GVRNGVRGSPSGLGPGGWREELRWRWRRTVRRRAANHLWPVAQMAAGMQAMDTATGTRLLRYTTTTRLRFMRHRRSMQSRLPSTATIHTAIRSAAASGLLKGVGSGSAGTERPTRLFGWLFLISTHVVA